MVRLLLGAPGSNKTYKIHQELLIGIPLTQRSKREIYVVERSDRHEYSGMFNQGAIKIITPQMDMTTLVNKSNATIYVDCDLEIEKILQSVRDIVRNAAQRENDVTIVMVDPYEFNKDFITSIITHVDKIEFSSWNAWSEQVLKRISSIASIPYEIVSITK